MSRVFHAAIVVAIVLFAGCEDPFVDPFLPGKHYTVYGFLDAFENDHFVRVIPVRRTPEDIRDEDSPQAEIDAVVTSTDLASGVTIRWRHALQRLSDGTYGHVFSASFTVRKGHRYRLVVQRSDGAESVAETTVPDLKMPTVRPATITADSVTQVVAWPEAGVPQKIDVAYCAKPVGAFSCSDIVIAYRRAGRKTSEGWEVPVALGRDLLFVRQQLGVSNSVVLELSTLEMRFLSLDEDWEAPQGPFDPDVFAQPSALSNVENGFGFWGSVAVARHSWIPGRNALEMMHYVPPA